MEKIKKILAVILIQAFLLIPAASYAQGSDASGFYEIYSTLSPRLGMPDKSIAASFARSQEKGWIKRVREVVSGAIEKHPVVITGVLWALVGGGIFAIQNLPPDYFSRTTSLSKIEFRQPDYGPYEILKNMPHFSVEKIDERTKRLLSNIKAFPFKPEVLYSTYDGIRLGQLYILREAGKPENLNIEFYVENAQMEFLVEQLTMGDNMSAEVFLARTAAIILNPGFEYFSTEERAQLFAPMRKGLVWVMENGNSAQAEFALDIAEEYFDELFLEREDNAEILEYLIKMISNRDVTVRLNHALQSFRHLSSFKKAGMDILMMRVFCQANLSGHLLLSERLRAAAFVLNNYDTMIINPGNIYDLTPDALAQVKALVVNIINDALYYPDKKINESAVILVDKFRHVFTESQLRSIDQLIRGIDLDILFSVNDSDLLTDELFSSHRSDAGNFLFDTKVYPFDLNKVLSAAKEAVTIPLSMLRRIEELERESPMRTLLAQLDLVSAKDLFAHAVAGDVGSLISDLQGWKAGRNAAMRILLAQLETLSADDLLAHASAIMLSPDFNYLSLEEQRQIFAAIQNGLLWVMKNGNDAQAGFALEIGFKYFSELFTKKADKKVFLEASINMIQDSNVAQRLNRSLQAVRHLRLFRAVDLDSLLLETFYEINFVKSKPEEQAAAARFVLKNAAIMLYGIKNNYLHTPKTIDDIEKATADTYIRLVGEGQNLERLSDSLQAFAALSIFKHCGLDERLMEVFFNANFYGKLPLAKRLSASAFVLENFDTMIVAAEDTYLMTPDIIDNLKFALGDVIIEALSSSDRSIKAYAATLGRKHAYIFTKFQLHKDMPGLGLAVPDNVFNAQVIQLFQPLSIQQVSQSI
ncbi:MAG: hypothetical protein KKD05_03835 [Candidatus Omnitrophica bacterium]|nr:hypothetical protein [Candidatus Omnitrophota bacterium]